MVYYRVVVVGVDGSETALRAVDRAAQIAAGSRGQLIVALVRRPLNHPTSGQAPGRQADADRYAANLDTIVRAAIARATEAGARDLEARVMHGDPVDVLVQLTRQVNADLLVVGSTRARSLFARLTRSVPQAIRLRANCEVLVVTADQHRHAVRRAGRGNW